MENKTTLYQHRQPGILMYWILGLVTILYMLVPLILGTSLKTLLPVFILILVLSSFSSMLVTVTTKKISIKFGWGIFRKTIKIADINNAKVVKNKWYYGWGIRYNPFKKLVIYNVSGFDAVELELKNGHKIRIGTDDPKKLSDVISKSLSK